MVPIDGVSPVRFDSHRPNIAPGGDASAKPAPNTTPAADLEAAVKSINRYLQQEAKDLQFSIDRSTGKTIVRVVNPGTGELIRQIPSEEAIDIARAIDHSIGVFLNEKA